MPGRMHARHRGGGDDGRCKWPQRCRPRPKRQSSSKSLRFTRTPQARSALILDDVHLHDLSTKGKPSQAELCKVCLSHLSTHHDGGLSVFICQQVWTAVPPGIRKLMSHFALFLLHLSEKAERYALSLSLSHTLSNRSLL